MFSVLRLGCAKKPKQDLSKCGGKTKNPAWSSVPDTLAITVIHSTKVMQDLEYPC